MPTMLPATSILLILPSSERRSGTALATSTALGVVCRWLPCNMHVSTGVRADILLYEERRTDCSNDDTAIGDDLEYQVMHF